jgi:probable rRNA maturation factor
VPVSGERVADAVRFVLRRERVRDALVSEAFVSNRAIARLNKEHLGHQSATDVISFALSGAGSAGRGPSDAIVGDIYIAPDVARENARRFGGSVRDEIMRLVVHGTLHVLGHDHPDGEARTGAPMWRRQEALLRAARDAVGW